MRRIKGLIDAQLHIAAKAACAQLLHVSEEKLEEALRTVSRPERRGDPESPYHQFPKPKRDGKIRWITAPHKEKLRPIQRQIYRAVLLPNARPAEIAHGFVHGKSIKTNAEAHIADGREPRFALNIDFKDAYPTVSAQWVLDVFERLTGARDMAKILTLLTTRRDPERRGRRTIPTGAPSSAALLNIVLEPFDEAFAELAKQSGCYATRYVDDLTVSSEGPIPAIVLARLAQAVERHGFSLNPRKTRRQEARRAAIEVTGLKLVRGEWSGALEVHIPRKIRLTFRSVLYESCRMPLKRAEAGVPELDEEMLAEIHRRGWYDEKRAGLCLGIVGFAHEVYGRMPCELSAPYEVLREMGRLPTLGELKNRKWRQIAEEFERAYADSYS